MTNKAKEATMKTVIAVTLLITAATCDMRLVLDAGTLPGGIVVEHLSFDKYYRIYHLRERTDQGLEDRVRMVKGVQSAHTWTHTEPYQLRVKIGHAFKWEEVENRLGPLLLAYADPE